MFHKKYRVKTNTTIKGSERKKLKSLIEAQFPLLSTEDLNTLFSNKNELSQTKALLHNGSVAVIYIFGNTPMFFTHESRLFPTVYCLWKFPHILMKLTTNTPVLDRICNGADLMAPGIIVDDVTVEEFRNLKANDICSVRIYGNQAAIAVGTAMMSDSEIMMEERKGKAVVISHCYKDSLWLSGDQTLCPVIPESDTNYATWDNQDQVNENVQEVLEDSNDISDIQTKTEDLEICDIDSLKNANEKAIHSGNEYTMDEVLKQCFLYSLKANAKKIVFPVLTSTFYRTYVLSCCPSSLNLDIKKTSFKKLSVFLKAMAQDGLISVKELTKGVESIVAANFEHGTLTTFVPDRIFREHVKQQKVENVEKPPEVQENYKFPEITEMFIVSAQVKAIFENFNLKKGEAMTMSKVREYLREYVKVNSLTDPSNPRLIILDPVLSSSLFQNNPQKTHLIWEELFDAVTVRMSPGYTIASEGEEPKLKKGILEPIDVSVVTRTGNKKVTLVNNVENFGINPEKFANHVQVAVAASTSIGQATNCKGKQVLIQGNQQRYLQKLLGDIYKVPKKYLRGLDVTTKKRK